MKIDWNQKYTTIAVYVVLTAAAVLLVTFGFLNLEAVGGFLKQLNGIMSPIYLGIILAYLFNPIMKLAETHIFRFEIKSGRDKAFKRVLSMIFTYIVVLIILTVLILLIFPQIYLSFNDLGQKMNGYISTTTKWLDDFLSDFNYGGSDINNLNDVFNKLFDFVGVDTIVDKLQELITNSSTVIKDYIPQVLNYFTGLANGIINIFLGIFFSIYFLASKEKLIAQIKKLTRAMTSQKAYGSVIELANYTDKTFGGFITGKILDSIIIGVLCFVVCVISGMPYAILVSTFVGITNVIPVVGPFIGAIPGTFIIFIVDPHKAFWFIIINIVLQQIDGNVISPKILGETTGLSAVWVLFSITVMGGLWGLMGMLISVPIFAILYSLLKIGVEKRLASRNLPVDTADYYTSARFRDEPQAAQPSFASRISGLADDIKRNHFGSRIKNFTDKQKKNRADKKKKNGAAENTAGDQPENENPPSDAAK